MNILNRGRRLQITNTFIRIGKHETTYKRPHDGTQPLKSINEQLIILYLLPNARTAIMIIIVYIAVCAVAEEKQTLFGYFNENIKTRQRVV